MERACSPELYPMRGNVAGSSTAAFERMGCVVPTVEGMKEIPGASFTMHVGDLEFDSHHAAPVECLD
eukprot:7719822-Pyramimonas_sp.AAC.1